MQIKFNHVYSEYDPKAKALHPGYYTIMSLKTIDEMKEYHKEDGELRNRIQMCNAEERIVTKIDNVYSYWNGCIYIDVDYKKVWNATIERWNLLSKYVKDWLLNNYADNFYYYETSRSMIGGHFIFFFDVEHTKENFDKYNAICREIVREAFVMSGAKDIIDTPQVLDNCGSSICQMLYITKINCMFNSKCNGKTTCEYPKIKKQKKRKPKISPNVKTNYKFCCRVTPKPEYIDHHQRWCLFCSLAKVFDNEELKDEWTKCAKLIPEKNGHTTSYYINIPYESDWFDKLEENKDVFNWKLLYKFGYHVQTFYTRKPNPLDGIDIDKLLSLFENVK